MDILNRNREWVFSGIGTSIVFGIIATVITIIGIIFKEQIDSIWQSLANAELWVRLLVILVIIVVIICLVLFFLLKNKSKQIDEKELSESEKIKRLSKRVVKIKNYYLQKIRWKNEEIKALSYFLTQAMVSLDKEPDKEKIKNVFNELEIGNIKGAKNIFDGLLEDAISGKKAEKEINIILRDLSTLLALAGREQEIPTYYERINKLYPNITFEKSDIYNIAKNYVITYPVKKGGSIDLKRIPHIVDKILDDIKRLKESDKYQEPIIVRFALTPTLKNDTEKIPQPKYQIKDASGRKHETCKKTAVFSRIYTHDELLSKQKQRI